MSAFLEGSVISPILNENIHFIEYEQIFEYSSEKTPNNFHQAILNYNLP